MCLVDAALLRPLDVAKPNELLDVYTTDGNGQGFESSSFPDFAYIRDNAREVADVFGYSGLLTTITGGQPEVLFGEVVTGNYFTSAGAKLALGRGFSAEEDRAPDAHPVVVISDWLWRGRFAADPSVIGKSVMLNGHPNFSVARGWRAVLSPRHTWQMADDDSKWLEGVLGAASGESPPPDMTDARCPKCGAQEFAKISELYPESLYRIEDGESTDDKRVGGMTDAQIVREFAPPTRGSAIAATAFVAVPLGAAAFYIYKKYGDNLGQIAAVAAIVIVFATLLTRVRAYSDKYYHARTRWNRMYMCRNCGQRVAG